MQPIQPLYMFSSLKMFTIGSFMQAYI